MRALPARHPRRRLRRESSAGIPPAYIDDVHRCHCQPRAVHHAAHAAIELDVVQAVLRSFHLQRIFLRDIAQFANIGMAEERVVIKRQLGVEREESAIGCRNERIDFQQRRVGIEKSLCRESVRNRTA